MKILKKIYRKFFVNNIKKEVNKIPFKRSYSQCGEDIIVDYIFKLRGITNPSYIDIGANDPYILNNTNLFYERGCRGINIDANPLCVDKLNFYRPKDLNLNFGVGCENGTKEFYILNDWTLSTFDKNEFENFVKEGKYHLDKIMEVEIASLTSIIKNYCNGVFPDFLSLDIEGLDFDVIKSLDFSGSLPKIICVEAAEYSPTGSGNRREELIAYIVEGGYYEYANTNLNAILVKKDFWFV